MEQRTEINNIEIPLKKKVSQKALPYSQKMKTKKEHDREQDYIIL